MEKDRNIAQILAAVRTHYETDLLNDLFKAQPHKLQLMMPVSLTATLRGLGQRTRPLPFTGGEVFNVISADSVGSNDSVPKILIRLQPDSVSDVQHMTIDPNGVQCLFARTSHVADWKPFHEVMRGILNAVEPSTGKTNGELIDMVVAAERKRYQRGQIESHANFGEW